MNAYNKQNMIRLILCVILIFLDLTGCGKIYDASSQIESLESPASPDISDVLHDWRDNPGTEWMSNLNIQMPGYNAQFYDKSSSARHFSYDGSSEITVTVIMANGLSGVTDMGLLILCDGIPVEFKVGNVSGQASYHVFQIEGEQYFKVSFLPAFSSRTGRIDFIQLNLPDKKSIQYHSSAITAIAHLPEEYKPKPLRVLEKETTPARDALYWSEDTGYDSWLWVTDTDYRQRRTPGLSVEFKAGTSLMMEVIQGHTGRYRTVLFIDNRLCAPLDGYDCIEWNANANSSLFCKLELKPAAVSRTFFTVTILLDDTPIPVDAFVSGKTEISG